MCSYINQLHSGCPLYNRLFLKESFKFSYHGPQLKSSRWLISYSWCHPKLVITVHFLCLFFELLRGSSHFQLPSAPLKSICSAVQTARRGFQIPSVYRASFATAKHMLCQVCTGRWRQVQENKSLDFLTFKLFTLDYKDGFSVLFPQ